MKRGKILGFHVEILLPHDRLDVYRVSLDFVTTAKRVAARVPRGRSELKDQLTRASFSVTLNIAEGSGEFSPKEKARFYRIALRSATECAAVLDILVRDGAIDRANYDEARLLLHRLVGMLTRLIRPRDLPNDS